MWAVVAQVGYTTREGYHGTREIPTFYLDERVQGILTAEQAERVARTILRWDELIPERPTMPGVAQSELIIHVEKVA